MNNRFRSVPAFIMLTIVLAACASPAGVDSTKPSSSNQVATVVAMTLQALTPKPPAGLLPHSFYYLSPDENTGLTQVFRMERDARTGVQPANILGTQLTFESASVTGYDVSLVDGSVVYVANNQLLLINADGSGRRVLVDGGTLNGSVVSTTIINRPVFSPDGKTIAYGYLGLNFYSMDTGASNRVFEDQYDTNPSGGLMARELYSPEKYSPDGTKLLITLQHFESADAALYYPATNTLIRLHGDPAVFCCDDTEWSADSSSFYAAVPRSGVDSGGLWRVDSSTGAVTTLLSLSTTYQEGGITNYADEPYLAPDGQLYFFLVNYDERLDHAHLQLVRSAPDGVTGRTVLSDEDFQLMVEALWAPDASLVVVSLAPVEEIYQGSRTIVIYLDGRENMLLTWFVHEMKWGP